MEIFGKSVKMTISMIILVALIVLLIVTMMIYCRMDNPSGLWGGIVWKLCSRLDCGNNSVSYCVARLYTDRKTKKTQVERGLIQ